VSKESIAQATKDVDEVGKEAAEIVSLRLIGFCRIAAASNILCLKELLTLCHPSDHLSFTFHRILGGRK
jgi:hypothetical protein